MTEIKERKTLLQLAAVANLEVSDSEQNYDSRAPTMCSPWRPERSARV